MSDAEMQSNPFIYDKFVRGCTAFLCVAVGLVYAFVFGLAAGPDTELIIADGLVSSVMGYAVCALLWHVHHYSIPSATGYQAFIMYAFYCLLSILLITGAETLLVYEAFDGELVSFAGTLPARAFCLVMFYFVINLLLAFVMKVDEDGEQDADFDPAPDDDADSSEPVALSAKNPGKILERITVKTGQEIEVIPVEDILYIKAEDDYVDFVTSDGSWLKAGTLKEYDSLLPADKFARIHRSYIVNLEKITKIERFGQQQLLQLSDGTSLRISVNGYKILREKLEL
ncbi:MAG: LytTR family transcriptional regulator DNA-binding domain-containing protein [Bacteroidales bacterium]|jgi:hypothetical protein|nr:LytTR family transcriptional regulator DNA-binding domain-containing protein [Bacteroidales bacterium]MCI1785310.1 LytTR family transcriptional regulator DNA-binding domain-containing protein [Bacteroidales bacterium]